MSVQLAAELDATRERADDDRMKWESEVSEEKRRREEACRSVHCGCTCEIEAANDELKDILIHVQTAGRATRAQHSCSRARRRRLSAV